MEIAGMPTPAQSGSALKVAFAQELSCLLEAPPEFVELLPVAAYACDAGGHVLWFNRRAKELWGRAPRIGDATERFCGSYKLYFGGRQISREETPMAHALRTGETIDGAEGIVERPDGSKVWAMVHIAPVKDASGRVLGAINCFHDTSEVHRLSAKLEDNQAQLEDFFENGAVAMHIVDARGRIVRANKAELALLGYAKEDYVGADIRSFHADADTIAGILERLARRENLTAYPARLKARDGSLRHVLITSSANFSEGRFANTRCFTLDVTAEVLAKKRASQTEEHFRQLLEALPAAVYTTDEQGRITYYNAAAVEFAGRTPELGSDKWCVTWKLYRPDGTPLPHDECPMAVALKEGRPIRNTEAIAERPDGTRVPFLPFPMPLFDEGGQVTGAVNMLVDISERKQAESHQVMLLRELNHRVKNNMQMLQAMLIAAQRETGDPAAKEVLADATKRVSAMSAAQQVLYAQGHTTSFRATEFLEAVCATVQSAFGEQAQIEIAAANVTLSNDVAMPLALMLNELLTNAVKHGAQARTAKITVAFAAGDDECVLRVEDDGPGFTWDSNARKRSSGLGLVTGLARQIGGSFAVESAHGARCVVRIPARCAALQ